jgi:hypothetical protein
MFVGGAADTVDAMEHVDTDGLDLVRRDTPRALTVAFGSVALALFVWQLASGNAGAALLTLPLFAAAALVGIAVVNSLLMPYRAQLAPDGIRVRHGAGWARHAWDDIAAVGPITERTAQWPMRSALHHGQLSFTVELRDGTKLRLRNVQRTPEYFEQVHAAITPSN